MRTQGWLIRLACAVQATSASLAECRDLCEWFGVSRRRATFRDWYQAYADQYDHDVTGDPDCVAVDEKQVQLAHEDTVRLYAASDVESKVVLAARLSRNRGRDPAETLRRELKGNLCVDDTEFLVDGTGYPTDWARSNLSVYLDYLERTLVEKLFQTYTMRIGQFHGTRNGSQTSAKRWLTVYTAYYNHHRPHQVLENQPPIKTLN